ncbi:hypothetical protein [Cedecea neteri]|uniref:hypothetical protein n=1 Tax=Cedecea neteri TaxID=158822 RepID=UPI00068B99D3|nr:hypothetical protein [Cedecea neteri]
MKNLSSDRLLQRLQQFDAAGAEARAIGDDEFAEECEDVARALRELLALRDAGKEPVAWLWRWSDDAEGSWRYSEDKKETHCSVTAKLLYAAPQLPAVPDEREAFEIFMVQRFGESIDQRRAKNGDNEYMAWDKAVAWTVWQHRAAIAAAPKPD